MAGAFLPTPDHRPFLYGRSLRSIPMRSMMRLAISSIEHSVVSIDGTPCLWNRFSALRTSNSHCAIDA